jgi:hypothetical protein
VILRTGQRVESTQGRSNPSRAGIIRNPQSAIFSRTLLVACLLAIAGCNILGPLAYFAGPRRIQKKDFELPHGRLAVLIDYAHPDEAHPIFEQVLVEKLSSIFRERKIQAQVIPPVDLARLKQFQPESRKWSVQKIGRELNAGAVLVIDVERLQLRVSPSHPLIEPLVEGKLKLVDTELPEDQARLWPKDEKPRPFDASRDPVEAVNSTVIDDAAAKLAADAAQIIALYFYDVDLEEKTPKER